VTTPHFTGAAEVGSTVVLSAHNVATNVTTQIASGVATSGAYNFQSLGLVDGTYIISAHQTDIANNVSPESPGLTIIIDTVPPVASIVTFQPQNGVPFSGKVAHFNDANPFGTAVIDWGDSSQTTGTITSDGAGGFDVSGNHTYSSVSTFSTSVLITDAAGN